MHCDNDFDHVDNIDCFVIDCESSALFCLDNIYDQVNAKLLGSCLPADGPTAFEASARPLF